MVGGKPGQAWQAEKVENKNFLLRRAWTILRCFAGLVKGPGRERAFLGGDMV